MTTTLFATHYNELIALNGRYLLFQNAYQDLDIKINSLLEKIQQLETVSRELGRFPLNNIVH